MVRTTINKEGFLGRKVDHSERKSELLKEIIKNSILVRLLFNRITSEFTFTVINGNNYSL